MSNSWSRFNEGLGVDEDLAVLSSAAGGIAGERFLVSDLFGTANNFYGGQFGARAEYRHGNWFVQATGEVALGDTHEAVGINGETVITSPTAGTTTSSGGLLALAGTNIGHFSHDSFAVVPEGGLTVGYQPSSRLRVYAGYTFLYWSAVARPGDQIDVGVNPARISANRPVGGPFGPARPGFSLNETDFWAQGVHVGIELRF